MKKQVILKLSIILIIIGGICAVAGWSLGGSTTIVKNKNGYQIPTKELIEINEPVDAFKVIDIEAHQIDHIEIISSNQFGIEVEYQGYAGKISYKVENEMLIIEQDRTQVQFGISLPTFFETSIKVYVPQDASLNSINIKTSYSNTKLANINTHDLTIENPYGNVSLNQVTSIMTSIQSESANYKIENSSLGHMVLTNSYGNVELNNCELTELSGNLESGNFVMTQSEINDLRLYNEYGNNRLNNITALKLAIKAQSGNIDIKNGDVTSTEIENEYGNVSLDYAQTLTDYNYKLINQYGDNRVNGEKLGSHADVDNQANREINVTAQSGNITLNTTK